MEIATENFTIVAQIRVEYIALSADWMGCCQSDEKEQLFAVMYSHSLHLIK